MIFEITASMIASYKKCPRRYELEYVHDLVYTGGTSDALTIRHGLPRECRAYLKS